MFQPARVPVGRIYRQKVHCMCSELLRPRPRPGKSCRYADGEGGSVPGGTPVELSCGRIPGISVNFANFSEPFGGFANFSEPFAA